MKIGTNLKKLRTAQNMTQDQLAEKLYVTRQTISSWERSASYPNLTQLEAISQALEVDPMVLLYGPQPRYRPSRRQVVAAVVLVVALLVLWVVSWRLGPWARGMTEHMLSRHLYYYNCYYIPLMGVIGGLTVGAVASLRWEISLEPRGRWICLGVGLVLLVLLALLPVLCLVPSSQSPAWLSRAMGTWMLWMYNRYLTVTLGLLSGGLLYLGGKRKPAHPKAREVTQP